LVCFASGELEQENIMAENWLDSLNPETLAKAQKLIERMKELGAEEPEDWVESEITEDIAQMARFLILRRLRSDIDAWHDNPSAWVEREIAEAEKKPESSFSETGRALKRMIDAGVSLDDVGRVAKSVAFEATFNVLNLIDEAGDPDAEGDDLPGWALIETDPAGEATGRFIVGLHEDLY
jgi:hypothetical protein